MPATAPLLRPPSLLLTLSLLLLLPLTLLLPVAGGSPTSNTSRPHSWTGE